MARKYHIVVLPGDGIGREVIPEAVKVLRAVEEKVSGLNFEFEEFECGAEYWLKTRKREEWPPEAFEACKKADAILLGAVGLPDVVRADGTPVGADVVFGLRFGLDLYANVRPIKLYEGIECPVKGKKPNQIDFVIVRENTEGLYVNAHGKLWRGNQTELAVDVRIITRKGAERIIRYAFELSRNRKGAPEDGKHRVTCVDKSNVLQGCILFRKIFDEIAVEFSEIEKEYAYVDAFTQWMIRKPEHYDVVVTTNMFGDILSELGATLQGGLGMAPAANIGQKYAVFEPIHGSAPKLAGKKMANPIAAILASKMMLEWLSKKHKDRNLDVAAEKIEKAVKEVLKERKVRTYDLGGNASTSQMGDVIANFINKM